MNAAARAWARLGLSARLVIASGFAVLLALCVATAFTLNLTRQQAHRQLDTKVRESMTFLSQAVASSLQSQRFGRVEEVLNEYLLLPGVKAVGFRGDSDALAFENEATVVRTAPDWFIVFCGLSDHREVWPVVQEDGKARGSVSLTLSPMPVINAAWEYLVQQMIILLAGAAIVFFAAWFLLRANLKPMKVLAATSRAFGRGDFSRRMPMVGSGEFQTAFSAFNTMADDVQRLFNALNDSELAFSSLVELAPVGIMRTDRHGTPTYVNASMRRLAGYQGDDIAMEHWVGRQHPDDSQRTTDYWRKMVGNGESGYLSYRYVHDNGDTVWVKGQVAPLLNNAGELDGYISIVTDVTVETGLRARAERLSRLYETLSRVNATIVQVQEPESLFDQLSRAIVSAGQFEQAAFTSVDWGRRKLRQICFAGAIETPTQYQERDLDDPETCSVSNLALLSGARATIDDFATDARVGASLREASKQFGMHGATAVLLRRHGQVVGTLSVVSSEKGFFTEEVIELIDEIGRDVSFALDNLDRAEQKRLADAALARSEQNLNVTLRSIGDAVLVTDTVGRVTMMNPVAEALTGWSEAEARGRPSSEVFHIINQETRKLVESPVDLVLEKGVIVGLANHTVLIAKDGTERPIADSGAPIRYVSDGEINGVVLVFRDQSEEYRMQKALGDSERLYSTLVNSAPVGIFQTDAPGRVIFANDILLEMSGVRREEMMSPERWAAAYSPDDRDIVGTAWTKAMESKAPASAMTYRYVRPDGRITWAHARATPLLDEDGELHGYVGVVTDITAEREQRHGAERLSRLYATLSRVNSIIVQVDNDKALFDQVCQAAVHAGCFGRAMVTLIDWERRKSREVSFGGVLFETPAALLERDLDDVETHSLSTLAVLDGVMAVANDFLHDRRVAPYMREMAEKMGIFSAASVPIRRAGRIVGALSILSAEQAFFTDEVVALIDEIGRDVSFALDNLDRAEQKRLADAALARSEQNLNVTLRSIGDAVLVTDTAGRVTMMNPVAEALTGWSEAEARGRPSSEVFHIINQETRKLVESPVDLVLEKGVIVGLANHTVLIAKDGTERPIADSGAPIRYVSDGEINGVVLVFRDQSDEYMMLKALRDSERLYSTLAENVPAGIYLADVNGHLQFANGQLLRMLDLGPGSLSTEIAVSKMHPDDRERQAKAWYAACQKVGTTDFGIYRYVRPDGSLLWARGMATGLPDEQGQVVRVAGVISDITAEHEQLQNIERLSRYNATLSQINAAIVHCLDERQLYEEVARIVVQVGGFDVVNLFLVDPVTRECSFYVSRVSPAWEEYRRRVPRLLSESPQTSTLIATAVATGHLATSNDYQNDKSIDQYWRDQARTLGIAASTSVPLTCFGSVVAVLSLSSSERGFFGDDNLALFDEIGRHLSHALENLARERERIAAEAELARKEERLRLGLGVTRTGMYEVNFSTGRINLDAVSMRLMNLDEGALEFDFDTFDGLLTEKMRKTIDIPRMAREMTSGTRDSFSMDTPVNLPGGSVRWLRNYGALTAERDEGGKPLRLLGVIFDITATYSMEERDRLAATVFDNSGEAIMIANAAGRIIMVNQAFARVTGYDQGEALRLYADDLQSERHDAAFHANVTRALQETGVWQGETWRKRKDGKEYPAMVAVSAVSDKDGVITHYVLQETDISAQKAFEERISHLAYRDALTGLPNRTLLRDRAEQSIAIAHRENGGVALLFLDLDHFKNINDSLGHMVGDRLLKEVARRLTESIREMDTVGRLGGDEFLILLPDADADAAAHVAQKLLEECARPLLFESHSLTVTPSVGISLYPKDGADFDELLKTADTAMYRAKDEGRNAYRFYTPEMNQAVFQRMVLESSLRRAIERREFVLHYQPKFELLQQRLVGVEALIRWHQPEMGMISPAQFIPVAEESGLIEMIGTWVLEEACRQAKVWRDAALPPLRVAVNLSARQLAAKNVVDIIAAALEKTGLPGDGLEIEITESLLATDTEHTLDVLRSLKTLNVHVSVDDFGTGYSSLSYLKLFPIDRLKIDQSFVRDLVTDADDRAIATAVVTLGHSLGIRVIAEGVETAKQMEILRGMGCDEVQGYYLGRPIPAGEMTIALSRFAAVPVVMPNRGA